MILTTIFGPCLCKTWTCWVYKPTRHCGCTTQHRSELVVSGSTATSLIDCNVQSQCENHAPPTTRLGACR